MTSTGSHTPGMLALGSPKKSSSGLQALPGPLNKGGPAGMGSPTKSPTKQLPRYMEVGGKVPIVDPKLGPSRRTNVRNLPKIERKGAPPAQGGLRLNLGPHFNNNHPVSDRADLPAFFSSILIRDAGLFFLVWRQA